jgi:hypothetical protein
MTNDLSGAKLNDGLNLLNYAYSLIGTAKPEIKPDEHRKRFYRQEQEFLLLYNDAFYWEAEA